MLTKRTIIGNIVGGTITALGVISLVLALGIQESQLDEAVVPGASTAYQFDAPGGTQGSMAVVGNSFDVSLRDPGGDETLTAYKGQASIDWTLSQDGTSRVEVQNTGSDDLRITGTIRYTTDPILYTYHIMVIVAGIVIIGFSAGFSMRRPKGF